MRDPTYLFLSYSGSDFICGKKRQFIEKNLMFFVVKQMFIRKTSFLPQIKSDVPPTFPAVSSAWAQKEQTELRWLLREVDIRWYSPDWLSTHGQRLWSKVALELYWCPKIQCYLLRVRALRSGSNFICGKKLVFLINICFTMKNIKFFSI